MKRRILVINERDPRNPLTGGAETHIFEIFSRLVRRGHEVTLLAAGMQATGYQQMSPEVFAAPQPSAITSSEIHGSPPIAPQIQLDEIDLDIPTFLRRQRTGN